MCLHKRTFPRPDDNKNQEECGEPVANSADCDPVAEGKAHIDSQTSVDANGAMSVGEMMAKRCGNSSEICSPRVTPSRIRQMNPNEVFVFGSNMGGLHMGGAAAFAKAHFGAIEGQGEGLQGQCYAIPTMEGPASMSEAVARFVRFASVHQELHFWVTLVGCGIAGYNPQDVAPLFRDCVQLENVALPAEFWSVLRVKLEL